MARYQRSIPFNGDQNQLFNAVSQFLNSKGYVYQTYKKENLFRKGEGFLTAPRFIKVSFASGAVVLEAWIKMVILPGLFLGEFDIHGFVGAATNGPVKEVVRQLEGMLASASNPPQP